MPTKKTASHRRAADKKEHETSNDYIQELETLNATYKKDIVNLLRYIEDLKSQILEHRDNNDQRDEEILRQAEVINRLVEFIQFSLRRRGTTKPSELLKAATKISAKRKPNKKARSR